MALPLLVEGLVLRFEVVGHGAEAGSLEVKVKVLVVLELARGRFLRGADSPGSLLTALRLFDGGLILGLLSRFLGRVLWHYLCLWTAFDCFGRSPPRGSFHRFFDFQLALSAYFGWLFNALALSELARHVDARLALDTNESALSLSRSHSDGFSLRGLLDLSLNFFSQGPIFSL